MKISVFGGSQTPPGSPDYLQALEFGKGLAQAGHTVMTGGYMGTMEAVSRGAFEAGGHVIGVTCAQIEHWRPVKPNAWVSEELKFTTLNERLLHLITACDMAVAFPGGIGTLAEVAMTCNLLVVGAITIPPIILVSRNWERIMRSYFEEFDLYIPQKDRGHFIFCENAAQAIQEINRTTKDTKDTKDMNNHEIHERHETQK